MNLEALIAFCRDTADDATAPYLWSDAFITNALNEAVTQAIRRARLIVDSSTPAICKIALTAGKSLYDIDERVIFIRRVKLSTQDQPLGFARFRDMDCEAPGWEAETGQVVGWIPDYTTGKLRLYREPTSDELPASLTLTVVRDQLCPMQKLDDRPEINQRHHQALPHWALYRMFSVRDQDKANPKAAGEHLALFEAEFGPPSPAIEEQWIDANFDYGADIGVF